MLTELERSKYDEMASELDALYAMSSELICVASADGIFRRVNRAWESVLGYSVGDLVGHAWMSFVHPDDAAITIAAAREMVRHPLAHFVNRYRKKDGTYVKLAWSATAWSGGLTFAIARLEE